MKRLAIVTSHPIQYNAPFFQELAKKQICDFKVFYTWGEDGYKNKLDPGFLRNIEWDIPLLDGYEYEFLYNSAKRKGSDHFFGIINPGITRKLKAYNPDLILVYGWNFDSHFKILRAFHKKVPIIFRGDSTVIDNEHLSSIKKIARKNVLRLIYRYVDYALYAGEANKEYFLTYGIKKEKLVHMPHAVANDRFNSLNEVQATFLCGLRQSLNLTADGLLVFIFVGKFERKKNPVLLIEAFKSLKGKKFRLLFVGDGELKTAMKESAASDARIVFLDFQNQNMMPAVYRLGNVLVLPSSGPNETWGLVVNEAMASGMPVIVSNKVGCHKDLIKNRITGFVFDAECKQSLLESLAYFKNSDVSSEMGRLAKLHIQKWSFKEQCESIRNVVCA